MLAENNVIDDIYEFLNRAEISYSLKESLYQLVMKQQNPVVLLSELQSMDLDKDLQGALVELITA